VILKDEIVGVVFIDLGKIFSLECHLLFIQLWKISHSVFFRSGWKMYSYLSVETQQRKKTDGGKKCVLSSLQPLFLYNL